MRKWVALVAGLALAAALVACSDEVGPSAKGSAGDSDLVGQGEGGVLQEAKAPPQPEKGVVPDVLGVTLADAEQVIKDSGFRLGEVGEVSTFADEAAPEDLLICEQDPEGGAEPPRKSKVDVEVDNSCA